MKEKIIIGTRGSPLAIVQANEVKNLLHKAHPQIKIYVKVIKTQGDKGLENSILAFGGKGLFTAELEHELNANKIDLAVHSLKDLPSEIDIDLKYAGSPKREDVRDAFISTVWNSLDVVPKGGIIATGSVRRKAQLLSIRPDLHIEPLRGNVGTRLRKLHTNKWDGIIVAAAAMHRLNFHDQITEYLNPEMHVPSVGQGALGIEISSKRMDISEIIQPIIDKSTSLSCYAERKFLSIFGGNCSVPIGCFARIIDDSIIIRGYISNLNGKNKILKSLDGNVKNALLIAEKLAKDLKKDKFY